MQTRFSEAQLGDPDIAVANDILRSCVHCGFCTATCPTYLLTGDELDGPRGRIYLIKEMLEASGPPESKTVNHIDRCLSCLSCMSTCPASVNYMHLVDVARDRIEKTHTRPPTERLFRNFISAIVTQPRRFAMALRLAGLFGAVARRLPGRWGEMASAVPALPAKTSPILTPRIYPAEGQRQARIALSAGCAQQVLAPEINQATIRILTRHGVEVVVAEGAGCCGSLDHHMGRSDAARSHAVRTIAAWDTERRENGLDAIVVNTSGCGTAIKDYGFIYRNDPEIAEAAVRIGDLTKDISEVLTELDLTFAGAPDQLGLEVAYHGPCSLQHGQKITSEPIELLSRAGFEVSLPANPHLCCGSAGSYSLLQPTLSTELRDAKAQTLAAQSAKLVATGNIGCMTHLQPALDIPLIHIVELIDWATGGPKPSALRS